MNYITLMNSFWAARRSQQVSSLQADIYFFILNESNSRGWQNPFYCTNQLICASLGISEKSLIAARISLKELGFIEFENGITKKRAPKYYILEYWNKVSNKGGIGGSIPVSNEGSIPESNQGGIEGNILYKQNQTKPKKIKQNNNSCDDTSPDEKNNQDDNWKEWVESWFDFYKSKNDSISPRFDGAQAKALKEIKIFLEKISVQQNSEKDKKNEALESWRFILKNHSLLDPWLQSKFDLTVILKKINDILSQIKNGGNSNKNSDRNNFHKNIQAEFDRRYPKLPTTITKGF